MANITTSDSICSVGQVADQDAIGVFSIRSCWSQTRTRRPRMRNSSARCARTSSSKPRSRFGAAIDQGHRRPPCHGRCRRTRRRYSRRRRSPSASAARAVGRPRSEVMTCSMPGTSAGRLGRPPAAISTFSAVTVLVSFGPFTSRVCGSRKRAGRGAVSAPALARLEV